MLLLYNEFRDNVISLDNAVLEIFKYIMLELVGIILNCGRNHIHISVNHFGNLIIPSQGYFVVEAKKKKKKKKLAMFQQQNIYIYIFARNLRSNPDVSGGNTFPLYSTSQPKKRIYIRGGNKAAANEAS